MFGVLRPLHRPAGLALLTHLLQELSGERDAGVRGGVRLASAAPAAQVPELPQRGGAAHQRPGRAAHQRLPERHRGEVPAAPLTRLPRTPPAAAQRLLCPGPAAHLRRLPHRRPAQRTRHRRPPDGVREGARGTGPADGAASAGRTSARSHSAYSWRSSRARR